MFKSIFKRTLITILLLITPIVYSMDKTGKNKFIPEDNAFLLVIGELCSKHGVAERLAARVTSYANFADDYIARILADQKTAKSSPLGAACVHMLEELPKSADTDKTPAVPIFSYAKNFYQRTRLIDTEIAVLTERQATTTDEKEQVVYRDTINLLIRDKNQLCEQHPTVNRLVTYIRTFEATSKRAEKRIVKLDPEKILNFMDALEHQLQTDALHNIGETRA